MSGVRFIDRLDHCKRQVACFVPCINTRVPESNVSVVEVRKKTDEITIFVDEQGLHVVYDARCASNVRR